MSRTCALVMASADRRDERVCGEPAAGELTFGPRPFQYIDVCGKHLEIPVSDDVELLHRHPIPEVLR